MRGNKNIVVNHAIYVAFDVFIMEIAPPTNPSANMGFAAHRAIRAIAVRAGNSAIGVVTVTTA